MLHTHEVTGSSPVVSTKEKHHPQRMVFFFGYGKDKGHEPIQMQGPSGPLLPPVQKLVATIIFAEGKNADRVP